MTDAGAPASSTGRRSTLRTARSELGQLAFLAPTLVLLGILFVAPIVLGVWSGFFEDSTSHWVGLANYRDLVTSPQFWHATLVSFGLTLAIIVGTYCLGLGAALLLDRKSRGRTVLGAVFAIPWAIPYVAAAMVWAWMLDYQYGVVNYLVTLLHITNQPVGWLTESRLALISVVVVEVWKLFPLWMVMLLVGLKNIPRELVEAATVDGARSLAIFRHVTLPGLRPVTTVLLLILTIWVFGRAFTGIWVLTGGGPGRRDHHAGHSAVQDRLSALPRSPRGGAGHLDVDRLELLHGRVCEIRSAAGALMGKSTQASVMSRLTPFVGSGWLLLFVLFPMYWMVLTAFRSQSAVFTWPPPVLPTGVDWQVALGAFQGTEIGTWLRNSVIVSLSATLAGVAAALPGAYAIARFRGRLVRASAMLILVTQTLPPLLLFVPLLVTFQTLHLVDTLQGLILADATWVLPMAAWMLKAAFDGVPGELDEAAAIDGCNRFQTLRDIIAPIALPGVAAVTVYAFIACWDDFLFASTLLTNSALWPASVGLYTLQGEYIVPIQQIMACAALFTLPPVLLFLLIQRAFVSGLVSGAVKG